MPGPKLTPFHADEVLPKRVDVVIIGGGVIGAFSALELSERGYRVLLVEKGEIGGEQSSRNWGWVRIAMRDLREVPLMAEAMQLWQGMDARLQAKTGYTRSGIVFSCDSAASLETHENWLAAFRACDHPAVDVVKSDVGMIGPQDMKALFPGMAIRAGAALHARVDARAEPQWVAPAVAEAARRCKAVIVTGCAALGLDWQAGKVVAVETERGRVACDGVILAGGAWSGAFARMEGLDLPQLRVLNSVIRTTAPAASPESLPHAAMWSDDYAFRRRADGGYTIASANENIVEIVPDSFRHARRFWPALRSQWTTLRPRVSAAWLDEWLSLPKGDAGLRSQLTRQRVLDPRPASGTVNRALARLRRDYPLFRTLAVEQEWAGMIDVTPDAVPVISKVEGRDGLIVATGFSGHGFGISPGAGRLAADLMSGDIPVVDPHELRLSRFSDGSPIRIMGGV